MKIIRKKFPKKWKILAKISLTKNVGLNEKEPRHHREFGASSLCLATLKKVDNSFRV